MWEKMNIQKELFKTYNKVRGNAKYWGDLLDESNKRMEDGTEATEADGEIFYNSTFYAGAMFFGKIFLNIYNGDFNENEVEFWNDKLSERVN